MSTTTVAEVRATIAAAVARLDSIKSSIQPMQLVMSPHATEHDGYNWPESKNRSRRVTKKLWKRFGVWERRKPCVYKMGDKLIAHPSLYGLIERNTSASHSAAHNLTSESLMKGRE